MLYTNSDGGARGNPGPGAVAVLVRDEGTILTKYSAFIGREVTNNIAEYQALIAALELASKFGKEITCVLDSELVVNQLLGKYRVRDHKLMPLFLRVQELQDRFNNIKYVYVSREDRFQQIVDEMLNQELDEKGFKKR
ncbi:MAG TPA: ribonuclease HI family protein [Candidatus Nanoarchaeia archaeon]|nr:ribonuclease HI family protein [Candidatus Nanoarchaeia archaeon]